jgi:hypothetical protein
MGTQYTPPAAPVKATKAWLAAGTTILMGATAVLADDVINANEVGTFIALLIEAVVGVAAVYGVANKPK